MARVRKYPLNSLEPLVGDITFGAFSSPYMRAILAEFGRDAFARCSACMEFESFVKRIRGDDRSGTCLEIGTYHGVTAVLLSQYFERVVCVSVDDDPNKLMKWDIVKFLGIKNIEFFDCEQNEQKADIIKGLSFDFCYMDGDHTNDTHTDWALVEHCGRVLLHEYWCLMAPVWNKVNALPQSEILRSDYDCFAYWQRGGFPAV